MIYSVHISVRMSVFVLPASPPIPAEVHRPIRGFLSSGLCFCRRVSGLLVVCNNCVWRLPVDVFLTSEWIAVC
jgi:hypothetical protein